MSEPANQDQFSIGDEIILPATIVDGKFITSFRRRIVVDLLTDHRVVLNNRSGFGYDVWDLARGKWSYVGISQDKLNEIKVVQQ